MVQTRKNKIITVTLNPALDRTLQFSSFDLGKVNRVIQERLDPAGKGINVAHVIKTLGEAAIVTGFLGQDNADKFNSSFTKMDIENHFVLIPGCTRVNTKLVDQTTGLVTEVNFPGLTFSADDWLRLKQTISKLAQTADSFILSGSLPPDAPPDSYYQLITLLKEQHCKVFLDTSGPALTTALEAAPYAVKPNITELSEIMGRSLTNSRELSQAINQLLLSGIQLVVVSLGEQGALIAAGDERLRVKAPAIKIGSTVGAGDAMVAGLAVADTRELSLADKARLATAAAAATVAKPGTQPGSLQEIEKLLPLVQIENWEERA
ncbi:1-phosphofructokinase [Sporomusaceae bacterium BoRhaA]|uniref:1-phosphofructokinase n=1 Tax=Pelorhabdus rhamnosifermentans TaxID=2772457 RepID=UPI001C061B9A|nr:1-phosphofructokinase [Pelorhabdus rhamnosifermentans]MBU2702771.1 1-phosphofructokinase [Pelorhabdus rhamnosifermentans]